ncbi:MAG: DMT family transporter [Bacteroidales bacterium]
MIKINRKMLGSTYLAATVAVILWGFSFVWTNQLLNNNVPIFTFLFIRLSIAGILLLIFSKAIKKLQKITIKDFLWMSLMSFFEPFIYFIGESFGMQATGSAVLAAVIIATIPITCMLTEKVLNNIPFTFYKIIGITLTIPGIIMVVMNDGSVSIEHAYGIALLFLAVIGATGYGAIVKKLSGKYNSLTIATYQFLIGSALFLPFFLVYGIEGINENFFKANTLVPLLSLSIMCSCVAFVLWITAIRGLGITRANIFSALIPAVSALGAAMLGQEAITIVTVGGIAIVITGVTLAQR